MATPVKLYPVKGRYLNGVPASVHIAASKAEAETLIETGAFTDNPNHAERDHDAPDTTKPPPTEAEPTSTETPATAGVLDSEEVS